MKIIFTLIIISFLSLSCSSQKDIVRDKTVSVAVPQLSIEVKEVKPVNVDNLLIEYIDSLATDSSYYEAEEITPRGDTVEVKFYLKDKETGEPKVAVKVKQSPVTYAYTDTTHVVQEGETFSDYLKYILFGLVLLAVILILIKFKK